MMDALREGIHLRACGQRDPVVEYQREAYGMFQDMIESIKLESLTMLLRVQPVAEARPTSVFANAPVHEVHPEADSLSEVAEGRRPKAEGHIAESDSLDFPPASGLRPPAAAQRPASTQHAGPKVGRNEPCPCGSNKKYKKCHGNK